MAQDHPFELQDYPTVRFENAQKRDDFVHQLIDKVNMDANNRLEWLDRQEDYYDRRYARMFRGTDWPWPDASDIVPPTIDMTIDRLKSAFVQLILTRPLVTFEATNSDATQQARSDEIYFNWLLLKRLPDFRKQVVYGVDSLLQHGHVVFKVYWDYRTRTATRSLRMDRLPKRYGELMGSLIRGEAQRREQQNPLLTVAPTRPEVDSIVENAFRQVAEQIARDYGVDPDEKSERDAIRDILAGLKNPVEKSVIEYRIREIEANYPRIVAIPNDALFVPAGAFEIADLDRITHELWFSEETFEQRARDHRWERDAVTQVLREHAAEKRGQENRLHRSGRSALDWIRDSREGVRSDDSQSLIRAWEVHFHHSPGDSRQPQKFWALIQPDSSVVLKRMRPEPYNHGKWPFVQARFELNDSRFYSSRGVPEKIDDIDIEITKLHRAKLNNLDLLAPSFQYRLGSEINPDTYSFIPGRMFPVQTLGDIAPIDVPDRTLSVEREENILLTWNERYIGSLENVASQGNISEARTATEVRALQAGNRSVLAHRGLIVQIAMKDVYDLAWDLCHQYMDGDEYERVTGAPFRRRSTTELQRDETLVPVGTIESSDPVLEAQKAFARFQILYQIWLQTGGVINGTHQLDIVEALIRWLERENILDARAVVKELPPQVQQQLAQEMQARQARKAAMEDNVPMSVEDLIESTKEIKKNATHGGRQQIKQPIGPALQYQPAQ